MRFAPEFAYAWKTPERDLVAFSNYVVQTAEDPAEYALTKTQTGARFEATPRLVDYRTGKSPRLTVTGCDSATEVASLAWRTKRQNSAIPPIDEVHQQVDGVDKNGPQKDELGAGGDPTRSA